MNTPTMATKITSQGLPQPPWHVLMLTASALDPQDIQERLGLAWVAVGSSPAVLIEPFLSQNISSLSTKMAAMEVSELKVHMNDDNF